MGLVERLPMIYDSITLYSEAQERQGRLHKALTRLTVGYRLSAESRAFMR
jgi:hypothetical protein